jgi:hypothetical protein
VNRLEEMDVLRRTLAMITAALLCSVATAQVAPPTHESRWHHIFTSHREPDNLEARYHDIQCAIVQIIRGNGFGTGFYVSATGDVVTASHVVGDRVWTQKDGGVTVDLLVPETFKIVNSAGENFTISKSAVEENRESWGADVARIKTGHQTTCWLAIGDDEKVKPGQHVITMGFPGLAFGALSLYTGIVSATQVRNNVPVGQTINGMPVTAQNDFIRVQMPISGGLSGSPVIDDENCAVAVVNLAGVWHPALDALIGLSDKGQLGPPAFQLPNGQGTLNLNWAVGELANSFHRYASPGYGDSVPLRYLKKKAAPSNPTSSQSDH